jgi:hypothetical protein
MLQVVERAAEFLLDFARRRVDSEPFPDFSPPWGKNCRSESRQYFNDLPGIATNYMRAMHFSLAYVTRVTYKTRTLHRCAEIDQPADPSLAGFVVSGSSDAVVEPDRQIRMSAGRGLVTGRLAFLTAKFRSLSQVRCLSLGFLASISQFGCPAGAGNFYLLRQRRSKIPALCHNLLRLLRFF